MPLRVGVLSVAHMHVWGYVAGFRSHPEVELVGFWDDNDDKAEKFAVATKLRRYALIADLLDAVDAVVVTSENMRHADLVEAAASAYKHVLCEKPLAATREHVQRMRSAVERSGITFMTAFPCRFAPAYQALKQKVQRGDLGTVRTVCATNHGMCPFDWFVDKSLSGGGAMIDHVVHVADLLQDLLGTHPECVFAQTGNNMYAQDWDDTAMVTLKYPTGVVATLDSSWSRPRGFKTWGDVTLTVTGDIGVSELDMFGPSVDKFLSGNPSHVSIGYGSGLDDLMTHAFVHSVQSNQTPPTKLEDGLQASLVAIAGYESVASGLPANP